MSEHHDRDETDAGAAEKGGAYQRTGSYLLDHGACAACGKSISSVLKIAGQCMAPGCPKQICNTCWNARQRRRCAEHEDATE